MRRDGPTGYPDELAFIVRAIVENRIQRQVIVLAQPPTLLEALFRRLHAALAMSYFLHSDSLFRIVAPHGTFAR